MSSLTLVRTPEVRPFCPRDTDRSSSLGVVPWYRPKTRYHLSTRSVTFDKRSVTTRFLSLFCSPRYLLVAKTG